VWGKKILGQRPTEDLAEIVVKSMIPSMRGSTAETGKIKDVGKIVDRPKLLIARRQIVGIQSS